MFDSVTGDECGTSRKRSGARRSGAGWGSDGMIGGEAEGRCSRGTGRKGKVTVRSMSVACMRTYDKTAEYTRKPGRMMHENEQAALEMSVTSVLTLSSPQRRQRGSARPADGSTGNVPPSKARHLSCKDMHTPPKCTTVNRASKRWIGPSPNPRSCHAPSVRDRHGEGKREDVSEA
jgi:hypothetical protein